MLVQRCALEHNRLIVPVSVTKPDYGDGCFTGQFNTQEYRALVDTGAQRTVVAYHVIAEQRLMRIGHMQLSSVHGPKTHSRYFASIALWAERVDPERAQPAPMGRERTLFSLTDPFEVVDMDNNVNFDLILGFDVLKEFSFTFDAQNHLFELVLQS